MNDDTASSAPRTTFLPSFDFVLFAPLTKETAALAINRLREMPGVDADNSRASVNKGELRVRINGSARLTPDDVYNAIHAVGIDAPLRQNSCSVIPAQSSRRTPCAI